MRINEFDSKHDEFKKVILNHDLTEEQLDEVLPLVGMAAGALARGAAMAGGALARTVGGAVARGAGALARGASRGVSKAASAVGRGANNLAAKTAQAGRQAGKTIGRQVVQKGKQSIGKAIKQKFQQAAQNTSGGGSQGTQGTQGTTQQQQQQANSPNAPMDLKIGTEFDLPDPTKPNQNIKHVVKKVGSQDVEMEPKQKKPGVPTSVKFAKKDITG